MSVLMQERLRGGANEVRTLLDLKPYVDEYARDIIFDNQDGVWFSAAWMTYIVREVRENSALTQGHTQQHRYHMEWAECHHCVTRMLGQQERIAMLAAVETLIEATQ